MSDVRCKVCGQGFLVYWTGRSREQREGTRRSVLAALEAHHVSTLTQQAHPTGGFHVADWPGAAAFTGFPMQVADELAP